MNISQKKQLQASRISFFITGLIPGSWAPLIPFIKSNNMLDDAQIGLFLLCIGVGAFVSMPVSGILASRYGCKNILVMASIMMCLFFIFMTVVNVPWLLVLVFLVLGASIGAMDCVINLQAIILEKEQDNPIMSGLHALFSLGNVAGVFAVTGMLSLNLPILVSGLFIVLLVLFFIFLAAPNWRNDKAEQGGERIFAIPRGVVLILGVLCLIVFLAEGAMLDWSAVFLNEMHGLKKQNAGIGFAIFSVLMTIMRLIGDRIVKKFGRHNTIFFGALLASLGFFVSVFSSNIIPVLFGHGLVGVGCSNIVPAIFSLVGKQKNMPGHLALPLVTTLGYFGSLTGPALIGFVAQIGNLSVSFTGIAILLMGIAVSIRFIKI